MVDLLIIGGIGLLAIFALIYRRQRRDTSKEIPISVQRGTDAKAGQLQMPFRLGVFSILARITLVLYVPLVILAAAVAWGGGMLAIAIAFAVGLPWSVLIASLLQGTSFEKDLFQFGDTAFIWMCWSGSLVNVSLLALFAFPRRQCIVGPRP